MSRVVIRNESSDAFAEVDELANQLVTIDAVHHRAHEGGLFSTGATAAALATATALEFLIQTAAAPSSLHLRGTVQLGGDGDVEFYEGTTFSAAGTAAGAVDHNRDTANVALGTFTHTPTLTADGSLLFASEIIGGRGGNAVGGETSSFQEWILAPSTNYLLRLTNTSGQAQVAIIQVDFYDTSFEQEA